MLKIFITAIVLLVATLANAQSIDASYTYDANGNRTKAVVVFLDQSSLSIPDPVVDTLTVEEQVLTIAVYPNPTVGTLRVLIPVNANGTAIEMFKLELYNVQGGAVTRQKTYETETIMDLSSQPRGVYLLKIEAYGKVSTFKIIKQ